MGIEKYFECCMIIAGGLLAEEVEDDQPISEMNLIHIMKGDKL